MNYRVAFAFEIVIKILFSIILSFFKIIFNVLEILHVKCYRKTFIDSIERKFVDLRSVTKGTLELNFYSMQFFKASFPTSRMFSGY